MVILLSSGLRRFVSLVEEKFVHLFRRKVVRILEPGDHVVTGPALPAEHLEDRGIGHVDLLCHPGSAPAPGFERRSVYFIHLFSVTSEFMDILYSFWYPYPKGLGGVAVRLNPDCIRDILLTVEDVTGYDKDFQYWNSSDFHLLAKYSDDEVRYHLEYCGHTDLFIRFRIQLAGSIKIEDLSPAGHEYLAKIRSDTAWAKIREAIKIAGAASIKAFIQIASDFISSSTS